jgi:hypothetical protein
MARQYPISAALRHRLRLSGCSRRSGELYIETSPHTTQQVSTPRCRVNSTTRFFRLCTHHTSLLSPHAPPLTSRQSSTLECRDQVGELGMLGESRTHQSTPRSRHRMYTREATASCPRARPCKVCEMGEMGETPIGTSNCAHAAVVQISLRCEHLQTPPPPHKHANVRCNRRQP